MSVRIGIISDTHDILDQRVIDILKECDCIFHAGDVTSESLLDHIRFLGRLYVVRGNCDGSWAVRLKDKLMFELEGLRFLMVHNKKDVGRDLIRADVIIYGHTHRFNEEISKGRLWLNPGSCSLSRFGGEKTCAVMTVEDGKYKVEKIVI